MMGRQIGDQTSLFYEFRLDDRFPKGYCHGLRSERKLTQELSCTWKTAIPVSGIGGQPLRLQIKTSLGTIEHLLGGLDLVIRTGQASARRQRLRHSRYRSGNRVHIRTAPVYWLSPSTLIEGRSAR